MAQVYLNTFIHKFGEGNGNPLQCSCLENPRDGVAQSQTRLKRLSSSSIRVNFQKRTLSVQAPGVGSKQRSSTSPVASGEMPGRHFST